MNAIEVLKEKIALMSSGVPAVFSSLDQKEILRIALLALEKQEKLKEWLKKEIEAFEKADAMTLDWEEVGIDSNRNSVLKEVLELVGGKN